MRLSQASVLLFLASWLTVLGKNDALEQFNSLQAKLGETHRANEWRANLADAIQLKKLLNENPDSLLEVARAEIHLGDFKAAFFQLGQFVLMGQSTDLPAQSPDFAEITMKPEFENIRRGMTANRTPVSLASTAFLLPDSDLLAEDVDYDPGAHRFLVTSVREKKIVAVQSSGTIADFARAPDPWPVLAIRIDHSRGLVWATEVAMQGLRFAPQSDWGKSAVLCYDLKTGKLLSRIDGPRGSALGDMALMTNGDLIVSDGDGGGIYRLRSRGTALERLDDGDFISPQTPAMHPDGKHIFVPDYERGIAMVDLATKHAHWLSTQGRFALNGIDGLYFDRGRLLAIQNGTSPERVVAFTLDAELSVIKSETLIERSTASLGDPTHGVVVGGDLYYIANSGWDLFDDQGNIKPGANQSRPRMMRVATWESIQISHATSSCAATP